MRHSRHLKNADQELLLFLFLLGALLTVLYRDAAEAALEHLPGSAVCAFALLLILDAPMAGSLLAGLILPLTTAGFGAVSTVTARAVLNADIAESWRRLSLLLLAVPLHFVLCGWSLSAAAHMRAPLRGRGRGKALRGLSLLLMLVSLGSGVFILVLLYKAQI